MGSQIQYIDSAHKAKKYIRKSRIVCGLWIVFSIFYAIVTVMAFLSSDWIGNLDGESPGKFGPWGKCYATRTGEKCEGRVYDFYKMGNTAFSVASVCAFLSCLTAIASICAMLWFFFCETIRVYHVCGWLQLASAICMTIGCAVFPAGWDQDSIRKVCVHSAKYTTGECKIRWSYMLAVASCFDAIILSCLAFALASKHIRLQPDPAQYAPATAYQREIMNPAYSSELLTVAGSRKSLNLHPVMLMHPAQDDTYSQFSQTTISRPSRSMQSLNRYGRAPSQFYGAAQMCAPSPRQNMR